MTLSGEREREREKERNRQAAEKEVLVRKSTEGLHTLRSDIFFASNTSAPPRCEEQQHARNIEPSRFSTMMSSVKIYFMCSASDEKTIFRLHSGFKAREKSYPSVSA